MKRDSNIDLMDSLHRSMDNLRNELSENIKLRKDNNILYDNILKEKELLEKTKDELQNGQPALSSIFAEFSYLKWNTIVEYLTTKKNPAIKASHEISKINLEKKEWIKKCKEAEFKLKYYEELFPDLSEVCETRSFGDEYNNEVSDEVSFFLSKEEYDALSQNERNKLALERYKRKSHSKQHIGKMYERYIGWLFENQGFNVEYTGIKNGLNDLGRDLICSRDLSTIVIQCKYWSVKKNIHENIICQLYGTAKKLEIDIRKKPNLFNVEVMPMLITNIRPSDVAIEFMDKLGVKYIQKPLDRDYPIIKCNINNGEKIYHLPFDQKYDDTLIKNIGECYVSTVDEAVKKGFRRAKKWIIKND